MKFAHFEFHPEQDRLGEGPQSEVFKATDERLGRTVALKILRPHIEFDPEAVIRFEREAKHTSSLEHPNIATIYEYGRDRNTSYIAMEFLEGRTLDSLLKERMLAFDEGIRVASQVADALELVHEKGLIHRDLKPANIMVQPDGTVKLLDFGICRSSSETQITQDGMLVGTVLYMSPEQVRGQELDVRSDVFAFGSVFYHAFTGALPFPGKTFPEVCMAILDGSPEAPSKQRSGFPEALEQMLLGCLAPEPEKRYRDGAAVHSAVLSANDAMRGINSGTAKRLRGRVCVLPIELTADSDHTHDFAAGLRRDMATELGRSSGLDVRLVEPYDLDRQPREAHVLAGRLTLDNHQGSFSWSLDPLPEANERSSKGLPLEFEHSIQHTDTDEWGLQHQLVRGIVRGVRKQLSERRAAPRSEAKRDPERATAFARRAHEVLHRGSAKNLMAAISGLRRAIEADPTLALAHAGMAEAKVRKFLYWEGDRTFIEEAMEHARRALALDSNCAEAHTSLGFAYSMTGSPEDALREYRLAIQLDHAEWLAHRLMGAMLARKGNLKAAAPLLRRAIALNPTSIGSYDHLFNVLERLSRYEESLEIAENGIEAARKHIKVVEDSQEARLHLALLLARMGSVAEAAREVAKARERAPRDGYTLFNSACVLALLGERDQAMEALSEARHRGYYVSSELWSNTDLDTLRELEQFHELST